MKEIEIEAMELAQLVRPLGFMGEAAVKFNEDDIRFVAAVGKPDAMVETKYTTDQVEPGPDLYTTLSSLIDYSKRAGGELTLTFDEEKGHIDMNNGYIRQTAPLRTTKASASKNQFPDITFDGGEFTVPAPELYDGIRAAKNVYTWSDIKAEAELIAEEDAVIVRGKPKFIEDEARQVFESEDEDVDIDVPKRTKAKFKARYLSILSNKAGDEDITVKFSDNDMPIMLKYTRRNVRVKAMIAPMIGG